MTRRLNRILLLDDCEADNYLHRKIIRDLGVAEEVLIARCGEDALELLKSNQQAGRAPPELIFLDINTPGMEGWDFVEEFAALPPEMREETVIIMLSGSLNPADRERAESMPLIAEYRTKPLTRAAMTEIMELRFP